MSDYSYISEIKIAARAIHDFIYNNIKFTTTFKYCQINFNSFIICFVEFYRLSSLEVHHGKR